MSHRLAFVLGLALLACASGGSADEAPRGKKYALVVGVNKYDSSKLVTLKYAENDAEAMHKLLTAKSAGFAGVRVLTSQRGAKDKADLPTAANIRSAIRALLKGKTKHDTVLVALAGHGAQVVIRDPDGKGRDRSVPVFCPSDSQLNDSNYRTGKSPTLLDLNDLLEDMSICSAGSKLLLIDACRNETNTRNVDVGRIDKPDGVAVLFSCQTGEVAYESPKLKHGVFFHYVLEGLRGKARNEDGEVTWDDLRTYVRRNVVKSVPDLIGGGARQTPHVIENNVTSAVLVKLGKGDIVEVSGDEKIEKLESEFRKGRDSLDGRAKKFNATEAAEHLRPVAEKRHPQAQVALAFLYAVDIGGVSPDTREAQRLAKEGLAKTRAAAEKGDAFSQLLLGLLYYHKVSVDLDKAEAATWFEKASEQGLPLAQAYLGYQLVSGEGVVRDTRRGLELLRTAAAMNCGPALANLGTLYNGGTGVKQDIKEAIRYYQLASDLDYAPAQWWLSGAYFQGAVGKKDNVTGVKYLRKAADQHLTQAQYEMGLAYMNGFGVTKDLREGRKWFQKAAAGGHKAAEKELNK